MKNDSEHKELSKKMNLVASLLLDLKDVFGEKTSLKDKIRYLLKRGVEKDKDISEILGITRSHASKEKAGINKNG